MRIRSGKEIANLRLVRQSLIADTAARGRLHSFIRVQLRDESLVDPDAKSGHVYGQVLLYRIRDFILLIKSFIARHLGNMIERTTSETKNGPAVLHSAAGEMYFTTGSVCHETQFAMSCVARVFV